MTTVNQITSTSGSESCNAMKEACADRKDGAKLRGQMEALQTQVTELMRALGNRQEPEVAAVVAKPTRKESK